MGSSCIRVKPCMSPATRSRTPTFRRPPSFQWFTSSRTAPWPKQRSAITKKVKAAIFNEPTLKSAEINVETFKGAVQLSGFVNSRADIDKAVAVTHGVGGVKSVMNDMRLK